MMYRLQVRPTNWAKLCLETLLYIVINSITIYLFVKKPFQWPHEPEQTQRLDSELNQARTLQKYEPIIRIAGKPLLKKAMSLLDNFKV